MRYDVAVSESRARPRLLVVDDDESLLRSFGRVFRRQYDVAVAISGEAALAHLAAAPVDVLIVDYAMPGMNGIELLRAAQARHPTVARIMLTAYADLPEIVGLKELDLVLSVLMKPWERLDIERAVNRALQLAAMQQAVGKMRDRLNHAG